MRNVGVLFALTFANAMSWASRYSLHYNFVHMQIPMSSTEYGFISGFGYTIIYVLCLIPWGRAADTPWIGNRNVVIAGLLMQMIFTALQGLSWDFWSLIIFRFGIAAGQAATISPCVAIIGKTFFEEELSTANAIFTTGYFGGAGFVSSLSEPLSYWYGGQTTCVIYGLLCGFAAMIFFLAVPEDASTIPAASPADSPAPDTTVAVLRLWVTRAPMLLVLLAGCCKMVSEFVYLSMFPPYVLTYWADGAESQVAPTGPSAPVARARSINDHPPPAAAAAVHLLRSRALPPSGRVRRATRLPPLRIPLRDRHRLGPPPYQRGVRGAGVRARTRRAERGGRLETRARADAPFLAGGRRQKRGRAPCAARIRNDHHHCPHVIHHVILLIHTIDYHSCRHQHHRCPRVIRAPCSGAAAVWAGAAWPTSCTTATALTIIAATITATRFAPPARWRAPSAVWVCVGGRHMAPHTHMVRIHTAHIHHL